MSDIVCDGHLKQNTLVMLLMKDICYSNSRSMSSDECELTRIMVGKKKMLYILTCHYGGVYVQSSGTGSQLSFHISIKYLYIYTHTHGL